MDALRFARDFLRDVVVLWLQVLLNVLLHMILNMPAAAFHCEWDERDSLYREMCNRKTERTM
jgi:hypothetical protein